MVVDRYGDGFTMCTQTVVREMETDHPVSGSWRCHGGTSEKWPAVVDMPLDRLSWRNGKSLIVKAMYPMTFEAMLKAALVAAAITYGVLLLMGIAEAQGRNLGGW